MSEFQNPNSRAFDHLEHAADVARLGAVEEEVGLGRVAVAAVLALEHPERHQRVEEVARAARVEAESLAQRLGVERARARELREEPSSTALRSVFEAQNPVPSCMIPSGTGAITPSGATS